MYAYANELAPLEGPQQEVRFLDADIEQIGERCDQLIDDFTHEIATERALLKRCEELEADAKLADSEEKAIAQESTSKQLSHLQTMLATTIPSLFHREWVLRSEAKAIDDARPQHVQLAVTPELLDELKRSLERVKADVSQQIEQLEKEALLEERRAKLPELLGDELSHISAELNALEEISTISKEPTEITADIQRILSGETTAATSEGISANVDSTAQKDASEFEEVVSASTKKKRKQRQKREHQQQQKEIMEQEIEAGPSKADKVETTRDSELRALEIALDRVCSSVVPAIERMEAEFQAAQMEVPETVYAELKHSGEVAAKIKVEPFLKILETKMWKIHPRQFLKVINSNC